MGRRKGRPQPYCIAEMLEASMDWTPKIAPQCEQLPWDTRRPEHSLLKAVPLSPVAKLPFHKEQYSPYPMPWKLRRNPKENHWGVLRLQTQLKTLYHGLGIVSEELENVSKQLQHTKNIVRPHMDHILTFRYGRLAGNPALKVVPPPPSLPSLPSPPSSCALQ